MTQGINLFEILARGSFTQELLGTWLVMAILIGFALAARRALLRAADPIVPDEGLSMRSLAEVMVEQIDLFVAGVMDTHGSRRLVPFFGSLFLFILTANLLGLIPGLESPTASSNLTFALGAVAFGYFIYQGFVAKGLGYLRSFLGPIALLAPLMLPIELADNLFRPFSLGVRLYANMFADHQVLGIFTNLTKLVVPLAFYALGAIVCVIQALIFVVLTMSYVKLAQSHEH